MSQKLVENKRVLAFGNSCFILQSGESVYLTQWIFMPWLFCSPVASVSWSLLCFSISFLLSQALWLVSKLTNFIKGTAWAPSLGIDGTAGRISQLSVLVPQQLLGARTRNCMKSPKLSYRSFCNWSAGRMHTHSSDGYRGV